MQAIQHLVAAAVASLNPDPRRHRRRPRHAAGGRRLTNPRPTRWPPARSSIRPKFEDRLRQRIESIVGSVMGTGHSPAFQVTADMNYNHSSETSETFDPDSKVVRSTQTVEQNATDSNANGSSAVSVASALPNAQGQGRQRPEPNRQSGAPEENDELRDLQDHQDQHRRWAGVVKRLSVAVVVDGANGRCRLQAAHAGGTEADRGAR